MSRLLILIRTDPQRVSKIIDGAKSHDVAMHQLVPNAFIATPGPRGLPESAFRQLLAGTSYLFATYTAARANRSRWQNVLGPYGESRVGEPGPHERYVLFHSLGESPSTSPLAFTEQLSAAGIEVRQLAPSVYVAQPTAAEAPTISAKLGEFVAKAIGDTAVLRLGPIYESSISV